MTGRWTVMALEDALRELVAERGDVSLVEFCRAVGVDEGTVRRRFGDWGSLRERVGLPRRKRVGQTISADEIRVVLRRVVEDHGPALTLQDFERISGFSRTTIYARFGSWTALRELEGLEPNSRGSQPVDVRELTDELWRLKRKLGRIPKSHEIAKQTRFALSTYYNRLGGGMKTIRVLLTPQLFQRAVRRRLEKGTLTREELQRAVAERE